MKIVHFSWEFPPVIFGGLGTFVNEITQIQLAMGNDVTIFSLNNKNKLKIVDNWDVVAQRTLSFYNEFV